MKSVVPTKNPPAFIFGDYEAHARCRARGTGKVAVWTQQGDALSVRFWPPFGFGVEGRKSRAKQRNY